jgi:hypothetical protein
MTKDQIIDVFIVRTSPSGRQELRRTLENMTKDQLEEAYRVIQLQATEEKLLQIEAERAADQTLFQLQRAREREPQRKAEEKSDRQTFEDAARTLRSFGTTEANFSLIRQTLGPGFSVYQIQQMLAANGATLSGPTQEELNEWDRQDVEAHNSKLLSMDISSLRKLAREAGARGPAVVLPDETQRVRAIENQDRTYPELPDELRIGDRDELIDAAFIKRCSKETLRLLIKRYGSDQINEALRTRISGVNPLW